MKSLWIRLTDIFLSLIGLILLSPAFLLISFFLWRENKGGVFFRQTRIGQYGVPFQILKFRSMIPSKHYQATQKNDPRITPIGNFLRVSSLDELPQLWNVLKGDMSLVGPRPDLAIQERDYTPEQWQQRCKLKPGITGLAQTSGRSELTIEERISKDLQYVQQYSYSLYLKILLMTFFKVIGMKGTN